MSDNVSKTEIKKMIKDEIDKQLKKEIPKIVKQELEVLLSTSKTKGEIAEISKEIIKKLYKDLSLHHPYIIDRIKL